MLRISTLILFCALLSASCSSTKSTDSKTSETNTSGVQTGAASFKPTHFSHFSIMLARGGGVSGLEERTILGDDGLAKRTSRLPREEAKTLATKQLNEWVQPVSMFLDQHYTILDTLHLSGQGNMTTGIMVKFDDKEHVFTWPNLDPPRIQISTIDSLYQLMLQVQADLMVNEN